MKFPRILIRKVQLDGVTGGHFGLIVGGIALSVTVTWAKVPADA